MSELVQHEHLLMPQQIISQLQFYPLLINLPCSQSQVLFLCTTAVILVVVLY